MEMHIDGPRPDAADEPDAAPPVALPGAARAPGGLRPGRNISQQMATAIMATSSGRKLCTTSMTRVGGGGATKRSAELACVAWSFGAGRDGRKNNR